MDDPTLPLPQRLVAAAGVYFVDGEGWVTCRQSLRRTDIRTWGAGLNIGVLAWALAFGEVPAGDVGYIDGDYWNHRPENLCLRPERVRRTAAEILDGPGRRGTRTP